MSRKTDMDNISELGAQADMENINELGVHIKSLSYAGHKRKLEETCRDQPSLYFALKSQWPDLNSIQRCITPDVIALPDKPC